LLRGRPIFRASLRSKFNRHENPIVQLDIGFGRFVHAFA
jgi:hypothetical protein